MAEINLLQSNNTKSSGESSGHKLLNTVGVIILVLVLASYGLLFVLNKSAVSKAQKATDEQTGIQQSIQNQSQYPILVSNQQKIKNLSTLLDSHLNWCMIIPDFAQNTLKTAKFSKFDANLDGSATITGSVPDFQNLSKLIQAYQLSPKQFVKEVKLINIGLSSEAKNEIIYTINITFNQKVLQEYVNQCNS